MSGAEISSLISNVIDIIGAARRLYEVASDAKGQPVEYRQVAVRLPLIIGVLKSAKERVQTLNKTDQHDLQALLQSVKDKAESLEKLFRRVVRKDDDKWYERHKKAVVAVSKVKEVESLMGEILKDVNVIMCDKLKDIVTGDQIKEPEKANKDIQEGPSSRPEQAGSGLKNHVDKFNSNVNIGRKLLHDEHGNVYQTNLAGDPQSGGKPAQQVVSHCSISPSMVQAETTLAASHPVEWPKIPLNPTIIIPFSRDEDFVERSVLDQIHQRCATPGSRTALVGLGGIGKSQLAIEYAYQIRERSPSVWILWVHASNAGRFEQSFREIANCVKISGQDSPQADFFQVVHDWLRDEKNGRWVLILDNVDDASFLVENRGTGENGQVNDVISGYARPLVSYLPHCLHGSMLMSTRSEDEALRLVAKRDLITINPMGTEDALKLFETKLGRNYDGSNEDGVATELLIALELMPLAIVQAAAYISRRSSRYSVREYLQDFRESDRNRTRLLEHNVEQLHRDSEANNSIIVTWQISFDYINKIRPSATDLLSLMSFFDRQEIPDFLTKKSDKPSQLGQGQKQGIWSDCVDSDNSCSDDEESSTSQPDLSDEFEEDVSVLRNYSFISVNANGTTFEMHRLVQLAMRKWLDAHGQRERWNYHFLKTLDATLPNGDYENWEMCRPLFPHAQSAAAQKPKERASLLHWASILCNAAWFALRMGNLVEAEQMAIHAMKVRKRILGNGNRDTIFAISMLAWTYNMNGRWDAAEKLQLQIMETRKTKLGVDHLDTLKKLYVMKTRRMKLGVDHLDTITSMANLASTYRGQGRWDDAKELELQVMEVRKTELGEDHPDTLMSMANLASTYRKQGRWDVAEELHVKVMETRRKKLGVDHPSTLTSMVNIALAYKIQGRWDNAEQLEVQAMETRRVKLGVNHYSTLTSMHNLAHTWKANGRGPEAIRLMEECIQLRKRILRHDHPYLIGSCKALDAWKAEQAEAALLVQNAENQNA